MGVADSLPAVQATEAERRLVAALRAGDGDAFMKLVDELGPAMLRLAGQFTSSRAVAEEVVQETWEAVLNGLDRFEGRSSLKTWIFRILVNRAKTRGVRERRTVPFASLADAEAGEDFDAISPERFRPPGQEDENHWAAPLPRWETLPERATESREATAFIREVIDTLPQAQRTVILLRDIEGWDGPQVSNALEITETNQRVLLHRARSKVRAALEAHYSPS